MDINTAVIMPCKCPKCETTIVATVTRIGAIKYRIELITGIIGKRAAILIIDDMGAAHEND